MESMHHDAPAEQLGEFLAQAQRLRAARRDDVRPGDYWRLKEWQARRLTQTYADLLVDPRYHAAAEFFLSDLYGPMDFTARDAQLARVVPIMMRLLPDKAIGVLVQALRMDALSESLDTDMVLALRQLGIDSERIDRAAYGVAYRACARPDDRALQIALIGEIGGGLDRLTHLPMIRASLRLMRGPAELAGLGDLHGFLHRGFTAFARMAGAADFLAAIEARETGLMRELFAEKTPPAHQVGRRGGRPV